MATKRRTRARVSKALAKFVRSENARKARRKNPGPKSIRLKNFTGRVTVPVGSKANIVGVGKRK
jgi:hypothetical protein